MKSEFLMTIEHRCFLRASGDSKIIGRILSFSGFSTHFVIRHSSFVIP
jgi:hypothetical protein